MEKARTNGVKNRPEKETFQQYSFNSILGQSKPLLEAIALARKVASTDVPVLLTGEVQERKFSPKRFTTRANEIKEISLQ